MKPFVLTALLAVGLAAGCSCRREPSVPAPNAAEAPTYGPSGALPTEPEAKPKPASGAAEAPLPHISRFPASKDPPAYGLPLEIKVEAPEVPEEIRGPTAAAKVK